MDDGASALLQRFRLRSGCAPRRPDGELRDRRPVVSARMSIRTMSSCCRHMAGDAGAFSRQRDLRHVPGAPLRLLADFRPSAEYVLDPGDLLYLPPGVAHEGTAVGECITYSIGFRAPTHQELLEPFLADFAACSRLAGLYADPGQPATRHPGALPSPWSVSCTRCVRLATSAAGRHGTVPPCVSVRAEGAGDLRSFRPAKPLSTAAFAAQGAPLGCCARPPHAPASIAAGRSASTVKSSLSIARAVPAIRRLADLRTLPPDTLSDSVLEQVHPWHAAGWLHVSARWRNDETVDFRLSETVPERAP